MIFCFKRIFINRIDSLSFFSSVLVGCCAVYLQVSWKRQNSFDRVVSIKSICWLKDICIAKCVIRIVQHSGGAVRHDQQHTNANVVRLHVKWMVLWGWNYHNHPVNIIIYRWLNRFSVECNTLTSIMLKSLFLFSFLYFYHFSSIYNFPTFWVHFTGIWLVFTLDYDNNFMLYYYYWKWHYFENMSTFTHVSLQIETSF